MHTNEQQLPRQVVELLFEREAFEENALTETELAEHFGVSRTPIRDALNVLEWEGLVHRRQRKGVYLRKPEARVISELYDVRASLESLAASLAADRIDQEGKELLERQAQAYDAALAHSDAAEIVHTDKVFHETLIGLAGNGLLVRTMGRLQILDQSFRLTMQSFAELPPNHLLASAPSHADIIACLAGRDAEAAANAMEGHILKAKGLVLERIFGIHMNGAHASYRSESPS
jgi:DNA-binding GntR family transcriptional regulator